MNAPILIECKEIIRRRNAALNNLALRRELKERYADYLISDQFKQDYEYNSQLFAAINVVGGFLKAQHNLAFKNLANEK